MRVLKVLYPVVLLAACASAPDTSKVPAAPSAPPPVAATEAKPQAPLFEKLGAYRRKISSQSPLAQRFFNQGMVLAYGFNHAEAARSFREALRQDPACAICAWGIALVLGPNINLPMMESDVAEAFSASRKAIELAGGASPVERALITALQSRYAQIPPADRSALDRAYADAMREVARRFPQDADVQAFFAESLLDLTPWNYWLPDGAPRETTKEAIAALERAVALDPKHPGALHYTIHALEEFQPQRAVAAADQLRDLVPDAGHLVHMPSHIYIRVGRYEDALQTNVAAGEADTSYIQQCQVQGFYPLLYHPHNWHFVAAAAVFAGQREQALRGAERVGGLMHGQSHDDPAVGPVVQHFDLMPIVTAARLGSWDRVLAMQVPDTAAPYARAMVHYARGLAHGGRGDLAAAAREHAALRELADSSDLSKVQVSVRNNAAQIVAVAERALAGDLAWRRGDLSGAIAAFRAGVGHEDVLGYNEPEDWNYPVRLLLGAALLDARRPVEAEQAFREDLAKHPENGWALHGLAQALEAQGKKTEARATRDRFATAWRNADIALTAAVVR